MPIMALNIGVLTVWQCCHEKISFSYFTSKFINYWNSSTCPVHFNSFSYLMIKVHRSFVSFDILVEIITELRILQWNLTCSSYLIVVLLP